MLFYLFVWEIMLSNHFVCYYWHKGHTHTDTKNIQPWRWWHLDALLLTNHSKLSHKINPWLHLTPLPTFPPVSTPPLLYPNVNISVSLSNTSLLGLGLALHVGILWQNDALGLKWPVAFLLCLILSLTLFLSMSLIHHYSSFSFYCFLSISLWAIIAECVQSAAVNHAVAFLLTQPCLTRYGHQLV